jgi:glycosyltransferase involved in cell wall biosynthesis
MAARLTNRPFVMRLGYLWSQFIEAAGDSWVKGRLASAIEGALARRADLIVTVSEGDRTHMIRSYGVPEDRVVCVGQAIDTDVFSPGDLEGAAGAKRIAYVGRLEPQKSVPWLLEAMALLPDVELVLVGDGSLRSQLASQAPLNCRFLGVRSNEELPALLRSCRALVLPSEYEGTPKAAIEAMACGLPVVAVGTPQMKELISDRISGVLVERKLESLVEGVRVVCDDHGLCQFMGREARREAVRRHSAVAVAQREAQAIADILGLRARPEAGGTSCR